MKTYNNCTIDDAVDSRVTRLWDKVKGRLWRKFTSLTIGLRRRQLYRLYRKNADSKDNRPHLIFLTNKRRTRGVGLTTMMIQDCIRNNYVLYIGANSHARTWYTMEFQKALDANSHPMRDVHPLQVADKFILTDVQLEKQHRGSVSQTCVVVDNICTPADLGPLFRSGAFVVNGFVDCPGLDVTAV